MLNLTIQKIDEKAQRMTGEILYEGSVKTFQATFRVSDGVLYATRESDNFFEIEISAKGKKATLLRSGFAVKAELERRDFAYDANHKIEPELLANYLRLLQTPWGRRPVHGSTEKLKLADLKTLTNDEIRLTRLAIYARSELAFADPRDRYFFERITRW